MKVETIRRTPEPERLVCTCARGDYFDGFVDDVDYDELMKDIEFYENHYESAEEMVERSLEEKDIPKMDGWRVAWEVETRAKTRALLERLFRRGHWGPFEHPHITLGVKDLSRTAMAQITRHRQITFDVQSQRYVNFSVKDDPVKTPKSLVDDEHFTREMGATEIEDREVLREDFEEMSDTLVRRYETMVEAGVPKEDARFLLPTGTKVNLTMSMNARTILHIQNMRNAANAQWEARELSQKLFEEFKDWMPRTAELYEEHGPQPLAP